MPVKSLSVPSGMLSLCCTHSYAETFQSATMISPPPTCYALWQTKGCLILLSLSIVFLSVLLSLLLFSITPSSQIAKKKKKKEKSPHSLWIGQEVVRGLLLSALPLACPWHLGFFVLPSTSRQKRKKTTQPKQIKPSLSQPACLSRRCSISASPRSKQKKRITGLFVCVIIAPFCSPCTPHSFRAAKISARAQILHPISQMTNLAKRRIH